MILPNGCDSCDEPIDAVALPRHPSHDLTDEQFAAAHAADELAAARRRRAEQPRRAKRRTPTRRSTRNVR